MDTTLQVLQLLSLVVGALLALALYEGRKYLAAKYGDEKLAVIEQALKHGIQIAARAKNGELSNDEKRLLAADYAGQLLKLLGLKVPVPQLIDLLESVYLEFKEHRDFLNSPLVLPPKVSPGVTRPVARS